MEWARSTTLGGATEVTLLTPIMPGLVPGEKRTYEQRLAAALCAPAPDEPDLVVVLGEATRLPASLTWELGYSELVFLDVPWLACNAEHLGLAIDDFRRRSRRFGGVDS